MVMTAKHVREFCPSTPYLSLDGGKTFVVDGIWSVHPNPDYDVAIVIVPKGLIKSYAKFRAPRLGEFVSGFGIAYAGLMSVGIIAQVDPNFLVTNIPIGGMSGSAIVGNDGAVVGIVCYGMPDQRVGGTVSGGHPGDLLAHLLDTFKEYRSTNGV